MANPVALAIPTRGELRDVTAPRYAGTSASRSSGFPIGKFTFSSSVR